MSQQRPKINNIEALRIKYRKSSLLTGKSNEERKEILYTWRETLSKPDQERLGQLVKALVLLRDGVGELNALEHVFKLVEFVSYVDKFAITTPNNKEREK